MTNLTSSNLEDKRIEIIKAEIGALLFNLGKTHVGFWKEKEKEENKIIYFDVDKEEFKDEYGYEVFTGYRDYYIEREDNKVTPFIEELKTTNKTLEDFFNIKVKLWEDFTEFRLVDIVYGDAFGKIKNTNGKLIEKKNINEDIKKLINEVFYKGCENVNSGIDKGQPPERQQVEKLWISNVFGGFSEEISVDMLDKQRIKFFNKLSNEIAKKSKEIEKYDLDDWKDLRKFIFDEVKNWYSHLLSDSRFPINDITLWDQAFMTASLFKASLAAIQIDRSIRDTYSKNPRTIKWSILGVQYDKLGLAEKALKPYFIERYRKCVEKVDREIKKIIEIDYALGNEVYKDETGLYFIVPENIGKKNKKERYNLELISELSELKKEIIEVFKCKFKYEVYPSIFVTKPSRGTMNIAYLIEHSRENFLKSIFSKDIIKKSKELEMNELDKENIGQNNYYGLCQICRFRKGTKKEDYILCDECKKEKGKRIENWIDKTKNETIWTGDLQDKNGRIALMTVKFELKEWLNGNMLNTTLITSTDWSKIKNELVQELKNKNRRKKNTSQSILKEVIKTFPGNLEEGTKNILLERSIGDRWEKFLQDFLIKNKINFDNKKIEWDELSDKDFDFLAEILLQFLLRKNPSPARFRRIWETTKDFFSELKSELKDSMELEKWRTNRIVWKEVVKEERLTEKEYTYNGLDFWVNKKGDVHLISSIEKAISIIGNIKEKDRVKTIKEKIEQNETHWIKEFTLKDYYTKKEVDIKLSCKNAQYEPYLPYFSIIEPTPISWQFIIPAQYVPNVIDKIQEKYKRDFKYVVGKLPLHIGVVIQDYKKPLYIGLKSLRKIRRDINNWDEIKKEIDYKGFIEMQKKYINSKVINETNRPQDYYSFYPLVKEDNIMEGEYEFYICPDKEEKKKLISVDCTSDPEGEKYKNIRLEIYPNTFDFEFLDTNIRRNDIYYEGGKRILEEKSKRPFTWEEWEDYKKYKKYFYNNQDNNKLNQMISLLYSKIKDWEDNEESLKKFILSAFINIFVLNDKDEEKSREKKDTFAKIFGENMTWNKLETLSPKDFKQLLWKFIDMYDFWHNALKEL